MVNTVLVKLPKEEPLTPSDFFQSTQVTACFQISDRNITQIITICDNMLLIYIILLGTLHQRGSKTTGQEFFSRRSCE